MSQNESSFFTDLIQHLDTLIKSGRIDDVKTEIVKINFAKVPRPVRQGLAKICRRSGLISDGLRLLYPLIRNEKELEAKPTGGEIAEYSVLLSRNGSIQEALGLLHKVDPTLNPEALLYLGFCYISSWDYKKAAEYLEKFLASAADSYSKLIARVNLGSAYVALARYDEAIDSLTETIEVAREANAHRLIGNCFELRAQAYLFLNQFSSSRQDLGSASEIFGSTQSYDQLLILKWKAIMEAQESGELEPLFNFRCEALARKHWESVREADLFTLKLKFSQSLFDHLVIGTPTEHYKNRIREQLKHEPSESYIYGDPGSQYLDLGTGLMSGSGKLNPGKLNHQVLLALSRDFYAPRNIGNLFAELYPGDYFNVDSSPLRVRQALSRTRRWLEEHQIPVAIDQLDSGYGLVFHGGFGFKIPLERAPVNSQKLRLEKLRNEFVGRSFTMREACKALSLSSSHFHRLIEFGLLENEIDKTGQGKAIRYSFKDTKKPIAA